MNKHILLIISLVLLFIIFYRVITKTTWKYWLQHIREGMEDDAALEEPMIESEDEPATQSAGSGGGSGSGAASSVSANNNATIESEERSGSGWNDFFQQIVSSSKPKNSTASEPENGNSSTEADCMDYNDALKLPLREYAIKASYNSAYDGTRVSETQLGDVMYSGCRFVDLNVFYADDKLYVGFAADNNPTTVDTSLPFSVAMSYILRYAFVIDPEKQKKPLNEVVKKFEEEPLPNDSPVDIRKNYIEYPFIINLRVYRSENSSLDIIEKVAEYMKDIIASPYFLKTPDGKPLLVDGNTPLCQINRKFIVSMDIRNIIQIYTPSANPSAEYIPNKTLQILRGFVHILSGGHTWRAYYNYPDVLSMNKNILRITDGGVLNNDSSSKQTSVQNMYIVYPFITDKENPDSLAILKNYSIQTVPHRFYIQDGNLDKYNDFFARAQKPFVPMSEALFFIKKTESEQATTTPTA